MYLRRHSWNLFSTGLIAALSCATGFAEEFKPVEVKAGFDQQVKPFLAKYCVKCHEPGKKEGELDLKQYDKVDAARKKYDLWETAARRIDAKEMPPKDSEQPKSEERKQFRGWVKALAEARKTEDCKNLATDETQNFYKGHVMSRRLTRAEYNNSVRDLIGLDLKPAEQFPSDGGGGEGFDTTGDALFTSAILMEKYLDAADLVLRTALPETKTPVSASVAAAQKKILVAAPSKDLPPRDAASKVVGALARRAFRRPVEKAEIERLLTLFDHAQKRGDSYTASLRLALKGVLVSPHFLFLVEPEPAKEGIHRLPPYPFVSRLSYFLWSSIPDEELLGLAESGKIFEPDVLKKQVARMLADPRSRALGESFALQWLALDGLGGGVRPDPKKFPEFDAALTSAMRDETVLFFATLFQENRSLLEIVSADWTFLNERLAKHYGIAGVTGSQMRRVSLTDPARGGVLSMASVLTVTSYPLRTSPVLRGRWVLDELLGSRVPPPPPNVPSLPTDDTPQDGLTLREQLDKHRTKSECASCHSRMDPLGFGLENFDAIGRWRTDIAGKKLDSSGQLPSGEKFSGPAELKQIMLKRKNEFLKNLCRKMLGYALGRQLNRFDDCVVDDSMKALAAGGYKSHRVIEHIVMSYPFQHRYTKK